MPDESDPVIDAARSLQTAIGTNELQLRSAMGNQRYEAWERRHDKVCEYEVDRAAASVLSAQAGIEFTKAQSRYIDRKGSFWSMLSLAAFIGTTCGVVEFVRWVVS